MVCLPNLFLFPLRAWGSCSVQASNWDGVEPYPREREREGEISQSNTWSKTHLQFASIFSQQGNFPWMWLWMDNMASCNLANWTQKYKTSCNVLFQSILVAPFFAQRKTHPCPHGLHAQTFCHLNYLPWSHGSRNVCFGWGTGLMLGPLKSPAPTSTALMSRWSKTSPCEAHGETWREQQNVMAAIKTY